MRNIAIFSLLAAASATAFADDDLNRTISVEKDNEVVEHSAEKLSSLPETTPATAKPVSLDFSDWAIPATVSPSLVAQQPQRLADGFAFSRKRGYAEFGMGSYMNINGSAGYRIVDGDDTRLGAWLQHNSTNGAIDEAWKYALDDRIGLDFAQRFAEGTLAASAAYHFARFNYYGHAPEVADDRQRVNEGGLSLAWSSPTADKGLGYYASVDYNYFGFKLPVAAATAALSGVEPLSEQLIRLKAGVETAWDDDSFAGIDAAFERLGYRNVYETASDGTSLTLDSKKSNSLASFTPYYRKASERTALRVGARIDIASSGTTLRIAPDVRFSHTFSSTVSAELSATGGNRMNSIQEIARRNRYVNPSFTMANTYSPADLEARLTIGRAGGFSASAFVGYAFVKNALVPLVRQSADIQIFDAAAGTTDYTTTDLNGAKLGADISYRHHDLLELSLGYMFTPQDTDSGYIADDDRAEHSLKASLRVTPIKQLDLYATYAFRSGRCVLESTVNVPEPDVTITVTELRSLGVVSDFGIGATYRFSDLLHAYAQGNNLLNRRWQSYYGMAAQKANFMVGVGVTF